ncbi:MULTISPECIES: type II toxin-antitoxin system PemK/MazF family toxin [Pseudomonas]|uniref:Type II toxin-antitoxin system PemK/MazF family toxin n=1 Tax=Pseudomonas quercus TaxID=2722792 RepID=A0ABX0YJ21_9PSED|nr:MULTISPECIES: type II toxin-antitoxin system PemK/MazF family toxin [Pseudomonas]MBF7144760.1 type II toxin-antitoxin system PemK/MazF family toxin [Pseudomonas sp. LY10J]NJP03297.1 type II toxin-antitoxin system PemK/MazF family toxin [Pseudomonas quercus]
MAYDFLPLPEPGDIVWAKFPELQNLGNPGPKPRPALVIGVSEEDHAIEVAYGTSKKTDKLYPGEFVLDPADGGFIASGLTGRTKFDVGRIEALPFDSDWFRPAPGVHINSPLPKLGILHPSYMSKLLNARKRVT